MTREEIRKELANQKAELVRQHEEAPLYPEIAGLIIDQARKICAEEVTSRGKDHRLLRIILLGYLGLSIEEVLSKY